MTSLSPAPMTNDDPEFSQHSRYGCGVGRVLLPRLEAGPCDFRLTYHPQVSGNYGPGTGY